MYSSICSSTLLLKSIIHLLKSRCVRLRNKLLVNRRVSWVHLVELNILAIRHLVSSSLYLARILKLFIPNIGCNASRRLAVITFNLIKCCQIWMWLLHCIAGTRINFIRWWSIFSISKILRAVNVFLWWCSHHVWALIVVNCQLTHLLHLWLARQSYSTALRR